MMEYTTQMAAARQGTITPQMLAAAEHEGIAPEQLRAQLAAGQAVLPANKGHK